MRIVSSMIKEDRVQVDGRRSIIEAHLDTEGREHMVTYLASADAKVSDGLAARAQQISDAIDAADARKAAELVAAKERAAALLECTESQVARILGIDQADVTEERKKLETLAATVIGKVEAPK